MKPETRSSRKDGDLLQNLVLFARSLRRLGFEISPGQIETLVAALEHVELAERRAVRDAARAVVARRREELELFDRAFDLFWSERNASAGPPIELGSTLRRGTRRRPVKALADTPEPSSGSPELEIEAPHLELHRGASGAERLRRKDFADLTPEEAAQIRQLLRDGVLVSPPRRTRRTRPANRGFRLDPRRSFRANLRYGGEPLGLIFRQRRFRRRPLVVLADVSGSMEPYARILLEFIYTLTGATDRLEAFVFGTRLTRITRELAHRDAERALSRATAAIGDWGGGTRIGASLKRFNFDWARRVLGQGAVVLVMSDGWERGEIEVLERETARLARGCERLIWLDPLLGSPGYQPLSRGIRAILPHVDDFLPVHNLESLEQLAAIVARLGPRKAIKTGGGARARRFA